VKIGEERSIGQRIPSMGGYPLAFASVLAIEMSGRRPTRDAVLVYAEIRSSGRNSHLP